MSTFHAIAWIDHSEAHVVMFDREHMQAQRIKSRTHHNGPPHTVSSMSLDESDRSWRPNPFEPTLTTHRAAFVAQFAPALCVSR